MARGYSVMRPWAPDKPKLAVVGEAAGRQEEVAKRPFVGSSGKELMSIIRQAGLDPKAIHFTNLMMDNKPPANDINEFFCRKLDADLKWKKCGFSGNYNLPPLSSGKYFDPHYYYELERLLEELRQLDVNLVVPVGNTATWALLGQGKISEARGSVAWSSTIGKKVLPTYHPAMVIRKWDYRPVVVADFLKAAQELQTPYCHFPKRQVWIDPELEDLGHFYDQHIKPIRGTSQCMGVDIENNTEMLTHISFAPSETECLVVPFIDSRQSDGSYWRTHGDEMAAWQFVKDVMEDSKLLKVGQNFTHDMQILWYNHGIRTMGYAHDTMIQAHAIQPELPKGLGFLATLWTNEGQWKNLTKSQSGKREE